MLRIFVPVSVPLLVPMLSLVALAALPARAEVRRFTGTGYAMNGEEVLFQEDHIERWDGARLRSVEVTYRRGERVLLRRSVQFDDDPLAPSVHITNEVTGAELRVDAITREGRRLYRLERVEGEDRRSVVVDPPGRVVTPGGVDNAIQRYFDDLLAGKPVAFTMPVPSELEWYSLRIMKVREEKRAGRRIMVINLQPDNAALRLIAPTTEFFVDVERRAVVEYRGKADATDADGDRLEARVEYSDAR